jgi:TonB family protein
MPAQSVQSQSAEVPRLVALTNDQGLELALQELATSLFDVTVVGDMRSFSGELLEHSGALAIMDAEALDVPLETAVDAIAAQFPDLRLLVAGHSAEQSLLTTRIADQRVFRFVHKPASPQRLKLFFDAALRPNEVRRMPLQAPQEAQPLARIDTAVRSQSPQLLGGIGLGLIAAIATAAWVFWPDTKSATTTAPVAAQATPTQNSSPAVTALIGQADQAFAGSRFIGSNGTSAAELYRDALKLDANNAVARSGYERSIEFGMRTAEEALLASKISDAATIIEALRLLSPNNPRLSFLDAQVSREQARLSSDSTQRQALEARQTQVRSALAQMSERLRRGALIDPVTNSAVAKFREAELLGASEASVRSARETLVAALLTAADNEISARRAGSGRRLVDAATSLNSSAPGLDVMRRRLDEANSVAAAPSTVLTPPPTPTAVEVAPSANPVAAPAATVVSAPANTATPPVVPDVVAASTLKLLRKVDPDYPPRALEQLISGWVEMEFSVARDGSVQNVVITNSEPQRTFDSAALAAMRRYRFSPVIKDGQATTQRARMRMRFTAKEK